MAHLYPWSVITNGKYVHSMPLKTEIFRCASGNWGSKLNIVKLKSLQLHGLFLSCYVFQISFCWPVFVISETFFQISHHIGAVGNPRIASCKCCSFNTLQPVSDCMVGVVCFVKCAKLGSVAWPCMKWRPCGHVLCAPPQADFPSHLSHISVVSTALFPVSLHLPLQP